MTAHIDKECTALAVPIDSSSQLHALAENIRERDRKVAACAHEQWLDNGRDLLEAKLLLGHGKFESWCERELSYSKRTAEKLMQAAKTFGPWLKSESGSGLPPVTLVYALSAPSVSQEIRDAFAPRVIAGEKVGGALKAAIKQHRDGVKQSPKTVERTPEETAKNLKRAATKAAHLARDENLQREERDRQAVKRAAALDFLVTKIGRDMSGFLELLNEAGLGGIFASGVEHELQARAKLNCAPAAKVDDFASTVAVPACTPHNELEAA